MNERIKTSVLGIDGLRLTLDGKPFLFQGLSFFNALYNTRFNRNNEERQKHLQKFKSYGINCIRVWCQWDFNPPSDVWIDVKPENTMYTEDGEVRQDSFGKLSALIELADQMGMIVEVVLFSHEKQPNFPAGIQEKAAKNIAALLIPYRNIILQIWNEDSIRVLECYDAIKSVDPERIVTNSPGFGGEMGDDEQNSILDILTPHTVRGKHPRFWEEAPRQIENLLYKFHKPVIDDEPARTGTLNFGGIRGGTTPEQHIEQCKKVREIGAYHTYHHDMFQNGYGAAETPPYGIPDPEFSPFHRKVFEFLKNNTRW